jgi:tyrosine decarboxylase/aspartate 1-decarboxylase
MLEEGLTKQEIIKKLDEKLSKDHQYNSGSILGSMCTTPHEFAKKIYCKYVHKNLGDPGLFPETAKLEDETVAEIGKLFGGTDIAGSFTTGGSEANFIAMRIARDLRPDIEDPEFVVPLSAHMSFYKSANLLGVKLKKARLKDNFELDLEHFNSLINENTCGVAGIAGTTSLGLVDPIEKIGKMIEDKNIFFHVDAAFGGFVLPFLADLGHSFPKWDFKVEQVDSITADPHKMGINVIPSGGLFLRSEKIIQKMGFEIPYLAGGNFKHLHIVGTRPGGSVVSFWALMKYLGRKGFKQIIHRCMENTKYLSKRIKQIEGIKLAAEPLMNILGITTKNGKSICELDEKLREYDWMLGKFERFNLIRVVVMPHVKKSHLKAFGNDLETVTKDLELG